ncbi:hypothetical protein NHQ30_009540 [Ciborinia camelliae]|nr:hypothetical protein NHQ30_009540 [Ciborinia camelliae]
MPSSINFDMDFEYTSSSEMSSSTDKPLTALSVGIKNLKIAEEQTINARPEANATQQSVHGFPTAITVGLKNLKLDKEQTIKPDNDFENDFQDAWDDQNLDGNDEDDGRKTAARDTCQKSRRDKQKSAYKQSKPTIVQPKAEVFPGDDLGPTVKCYKCGLVHQYTLEEAWLPARQKPQLVARNSNATKSHLHIVACVKCRSGICVACGMAPHLKECTFADTRLAWLALFSLDQAVVHFKHMSPSLATTNTTKDVHPVLLEAITAVMAAIPRSGPVTFGLRELLRKSLLLDLIADIVRGMTVENMELSPLLIQTWEFLHIIAEHDELCNLLFEDRKILDGTSSGLVQISFPFVLLPTKQQSDSIDSISHGAKGYTFWSLFQKCSGLAKQYLDANHDDIWSASVVAQRIVDVYVTLACKVPPELITPSKTHPTQHDEVLKAGLADLYRVGTARNTQRKTAATQGKSLVEPTRKKRGRGRAMAQEQAQDECKDDRGGKRRRTVGRQ